MHVAVNKQHVGCVQVLVSVCDINSQVCLQQYSYGLTLQEILEFFFQIKNILHNLNFVT